MNMTTARTMLGIISLCLLSATSFAYANKNDIVVVPARARMVRLGFDIQALRGPTLLSYRKTEDPLQPLLHVWNRSRREWMQMDVAQIPHSTLVPSNPTRVYIIGLPDMLPDVLLTALSHANEIRTLQTFSVAHILTVMDQDMRFTMPEWKSLGERYNLDIAEINTDQRRWGRFGPPRRYRQDANKQQPEPLFIDEMYMIPAEAPIASVGLIPDQPSVPLDPVAIIEPEETTEQRIEITPPVAIEVQTPAVLVPEYDEAIDPVAPVTRRDPIPMKGSEPTAEADQKYIQDPGEDFPIK